MLLKANQSDLKAWCNHLTKYLWSVWKRLVLKKDKHLKIRKSNFTYFFFSFQNFVALLAWVCTMFFSRLLPSLLLALSGISFAFLKGTELPSSMDSAALLFLDCQLVLYPCPAVFGSVSIIYFLRKIPSYMHYSFHSSASPIIHVRCSVSHDPAFGNSCLFFWFTPDFEGILLAEWWGRFLKDASMTGSHVSRLWWFQLRAERIHNMVLAGFDGSLCYQATAFLKGLWCFPTRDLPTWPSKYLRPSVYWWPSLLWSLLDASRSLHYLSGSCSEAGLHFIGLLPSLVWVAFFVVPLISLVYGWVLKRTWSPLTSVLTPFHSPHADSVWCNHFLTIRCVYFGHFVSHLISAPGAFGLCLCTQV